MNFEIDLTMVAVIASSCSAIFAGSTYARYSDWRKTDEAKQLHKRVDVSEVKIAVLEARTSTLPAKMDTTNDRLTKMETLLLTIPTTSDIARLTAEMDAVQDSNKLQQAGIKRIEDFLLEHGK